MYISSNVNYKFVFYVLKTGVMASVQLLWSNTRSVVSFTPGCKFTQGSDIFFWCDTGINLSSGYHHIFRLWSGGKFMKVRTWKIFAKESQLPPSNLLVYSVWSYPSEWTIYEWSELLMGTSELAKAKYMQKIKTAQWAGVTSAVHWVSSLRIVHVVVDLSKGGKRTENLMINLGFFSRLSSFSPRVDILSCPFFFLVSFSCCSVLGSYSISCHKNCQCLFFRQFDSAGRNCTQHRSKLQSA
jgi:hypothetical protein